MSEDVERLGREYLAKHAEWQRAVNAAEELEARRRLMMSQIESSYQLMIDDEDKKAKKLHEEMDGIVEAASAACGGKPIVVLHRNTVTIWAAGVQVERRPGWVRVANVGAYIDNRNGVEVRHE